MGGGLQKHPLMSPKQQAKHLLGLLKVGRAELPDDNSREEEKGSSKEEREAFHEVQAGWVEGAEHPRGDQGAKSFNAGHCSKEGAW